MAEPQPERERPSGEVVFDSSDSIIYIHDGPGDTTRRPARPNIPRYFPGREPPPELQPRPPEKPPENQPPSPDDRNETNPPSH